VAAKIAFGLARHAEIPLTFLAFVVLRVDGRDVTEKGR
jgi:hypothetical protein